ncbi:GNAT family N-acetyltransferase [Niabella soli]|uniref:N-acetyltransferase n=1 Tax=Niabella soli DSM 19437 TaxID=929713 RepID=W0EZB8_9BACT|nr:GNAT family N-acetyltransferase [Niabella soli]AHF14436.1 N-acetyltransferase [Niabella soli DSM 19437]
MNIKRIQPAEATQVAPLFDEYRVFYKQPSDPALAEQFIETRLRNNESVIFGAFIESDGKQKAIGFTQLYPTYSSMRATKNWILNDLFVDPAYRKNGAGAALIRCAMNFAREDGAAFVQLETAFDNFTAQRLYEQTGFEQQQPDDAFLCYRINLI